MTYDVLKKTAQKVWRGITAVYPKNLYQSMRRGMAAVIEAQGSHTKHWCCILHFKHNKLVNELIDLQGDALLMSKLVVIKSPQAVNDASKILQSLQKGVD